MRTITVQTTTTPHISTSKSVFQTFKKNANTFDARPRPGPTVYLSRPTQLRSFSSCLRKNRHKFIWWSRWKDQHKLVTDLECTHRSHGKIENKIQPSITYEKPLTFSFLSPFVVPICGSVVISIDAIHLHHQLCFHPAGCFVFVRGTTGPREGVDLVEENGRGGIISVVREKMGELVKEKVDGGCWLGFR